MADSVVLYYATSCPKCERADSLRIDVGSQHAATYPAHCETPKGHEPCGFRTEAYDPENAELEGIRRVRKTAMRLKGKDEPEDSSQPQIVPAQFTSTAGTLRQMPRSGFLWQR